jgi:glutathione S-transferase
MARPVLVIGNKAYSSWSLRPWLLMRHAQIEFDEERVALYQSDSREKLLRYSPAGRVLVLIDSDLTVWDSLAICEYLDTIRRLPAMQTWIAGAQAETEVIKQYEP